MISPGQKCMSDLHRLRSHTEAVDAVLLDVHVRKGELWSDQMWCYDCVEEFARRR